MMTRVSVLKEPAAVSQHVMQMQLTTQGQQCELTANLLVAEQRRLISNICGQLVNLHTSLLSSGGR